MGKIKKSTRSPVVFEMVPLPEDHDKYDIGDILVTKKPHGSWMLTKKTKNSCYWTRICNLKGEVNENI